MSREPATRRERPDAPPPPADAPSAKVAGKRRLKREVLLARATEIFNQRGIGGVTLADIAAELGLTRAALYYYVNDRPELVFQCYLRACELTAEDLAAAAESGETGLEQVLAYVARATSPERPAAAVLSEISALAPAHRGIVETASARNAGHLQGLVENGMADGSIRPCDAQVAAQSILGMLAWAQLSPGWLGGAGGRRYRGRVAGALKQLLTQGIGAEGRAPPVCRINVETFLPRATNVFDRAQAAEQKTGQLLMTASRLFNRDGIEATSLDDISAALGATKGVVYHYMDDKTDLVVRCYQRAFDLFETFSTTAEAEGRDGLERSMIGAHLNSQAQVGAISPLMPQAGFDALPSPHREALSRRARAIRARFVSFLKQGVADGSARARDVVMLAEIGAGAFGWLPKWIGPEAEAHPRRIADEIVALLTLGLKAS
jgi:AcrR family transcriptional regulator